MNPPTTSADGATLSPANGRRDRRIGSFMIVVAAVGVITSLTGSVVVWQLLGNVDSSSTESLDVTIDTLDTLDDTIVLAGALVAAVDVALTTAATTLDTVAESFDDASGVIDEVDDLADVVGPALDNATDTLRDLQEVGATIDGLLESVDDLPLVPNYDPDNTLEESIAGIADELAPLPAEFEQTSTNLDNFESSIDSLQADIEQLEVDIVAVSGELEVSDQLVDQYRENIADARAVAVDARDGLDNDVRVARLLLLIGGINLALSNVVPLWLGRRLRSDDAEMQRVGT